MVITMPERTHELAEIRNRARFAILVVDWGTPDDIHRLLRSAEKHEPGQRWVIHRNYNPAKPGRMKLDSFDYPSQKVHIIEAKDNRGHGYGINRAAEAAIELWDPEFLFVLNPDTLFMEPILERMASFLDEDPLRCIVGPKQMDSADRITHGGFFGSNRKPEMRMWKMHDRLNEKARDNQPAVMVAGSAFLIRTEDWIEYGGLLETHHYYNETWLCYHVRAHGREVWYWGEGWMIHEWHKSTPMGGLTTDAKMPIDRETFRKMCRTHNPPILCD